jgi:prepilin-type N-terminal cleavage/methylation domain-containing protein
MLNKKKWFTIVELIVVITILAILSTIGYMSYTSYILFVRDSNRLSQLVAMKEWLDSRNLSSSLPMPDDYVEVKVNWKTIWYQWFIWKDVLTTIWYNKDGKDPKTGKYYSYYITKDKNYFQLMTHLEDEWTISSISLWNKAIAYDYSTMYNWVVWTKLWILTDEFNTPIQEVESIKTATFVDLFVENANDLFIANIENGRKYAFSWSVLANKLETLSDPWKYSPPSYCDEWFIWVRWDAGFNKKWFCVSKYEMSYSVNDAPWVQNTSYDSEYWATYSYDNDKDGVLEVWETWYWKKIASREDFPIAEISYSQAKSACSSLWKWYHLIKNSEWMSIARQIEFEGENWSSWVAWEWNVYTWNADYTLSLWCLDEWLSPLYASKAWPWSDVDCNEKRKLKLFNSEEIWDLSWNIEEFVDKEISTDINLVSSSSNREWNDPEISESERRLYWPLIWTDYTQWMWNIDHADLDNNSIILRWKSYWDYDQSWIYSWNFGLSFTTSPKAYVWFRCAIDK